MLMSYFTFGDFFIDLKKKWDKSNSFIRHFLNRNTELGPVLNHLTDGVLAYRCDSGIINYEVPVNSPFKFMDTFLKSSFFSRLWFGFYISFR